MGRQRRRQRRARRPTCPAGPNNYRLGTFYAVATAILVSFQEPFCALAARSLGSLDFMAFTQLALLLSVPLLILRADSRRDFVVIVTGTRHWPKLGVIFLIGVAGLTLYDIGLSSTHPIITAAVLNMSPFWAALIALVVSKRSISASPTGFAWSTRSRRSCRSAPTSIATGPASCAERSPIAPGCSTR